MSNFVQYARLGQRLLCQGKNTVKSSCTKRLASSEGRWNYRDDPIHAHEHAWHAKAFTFFVTVYIGYNLYHHSDHVLGHPKIKPSRWTNEELGIPPDDEDIYPPGYTPIAER